MDLFDEDFKLNPGAIFALDEGLNDPIKFLRVSIETPVQVSKLIEDKLLPLPILKEKERDQILRGKLRKFLRGETYAIIGLLLTEIVLEHEFVHAGVEADCLVGVTDEFIVFLEDLDQFGRELLVGVGVGLVGVFADLHEELVVIELF